MGEGGGGAPHLRGKDGGRQAVDAHPPAALAGPAGTIVKHLVARHRGRREGEDEGINAGPAAGVPQGHAPLRVVPHLHGERLSLLR